ncbi:MAG: hypothetical protein JSS95_08940 [Acidobacteria bacterium]|nr:hypothetical protein [Acidobacteriota bacterium]
MQALCSPTEIAPDVKCPVCKKGFRLFWERTDRHDQLAALPEILKALREHHLEDAAPHHPETPFNVPSWPGLPQFSGAALLGGAY